MINAYIPTVEKLEATLNALTYYRLTGKSESAQEAMKAFLNYKDCFYCQTYRTTMGKGQAGCCDTCPLHKYGVKVTQRNRLYNGCYSIAYYREVVRVARLFSESPTEYLAKLLIDKINECLHNLDIHRSEVEF